MDIKVFKLFGPRVKRRCFRQFKSYPRKIFNSNKLWLCLCQCRNGPVNLLTSGFNLHTLHKKIHYFCMWITAVICNCSGGFCLFLLGVFMKLWKDADDSYLQNERKCRRALVQIVPFPITNNNPHFLFRLSDVCISIVFLIGKVWLNPAPGVIWH